MTPVRLAWAEVPAGAARRDVAWALLRTLAPGARITNACPWCGGPHGPVQLHGVDRAASVSYAGGLALVGVADAAGRLGIDAEAEASSDGALRAGIDLRAWTRIEAALKADRRGLRVDPGDVALDDSGSTWTAVLPDGGRIAGYDVAGPSGILVSAAFLPRPAR